MFIVPASPVLLTLCRQYLARPDKRLREAIVLTTQSELAAVDFVTTLEFEPGCIEHGVIHMSFQSDNDEGDTRWLTIDPADGAIWDDRNAE